MVPVQLLAMTVDKIIRLSHGRCQGKGIHTKLDDTVLALLVHVRHTRVKVGHIGLQRPIEKLFSLSHIQYDC